MTRTHALLAALTVPATAHAQSLTLTLTHDDDDGVVQIGDTVTWTLIGTHEGFEISQFWIDGPVFGGMTVGLRATPGLVSNSTIAFNENPADFNDSPPGFTTPRSEPDGDGGFGLVTFTNSIFLYIGCGACAVGDANPLTVGTFTTTALQPGQLDYTFTDPSRGTYSFFVAISQFEEFRLAPEQVFFDLQSLTIVPTPASVLLLAPASLIASRRRH